MTVTEGLGRDSPSQIAKNMDRAMAKAKNRKRRKPSSVGLQMDNLKRVTDPRIKESRLMHPKLRLAMLDQLLEESLTTLENLRLDVWLEELSKAAVEPKRKTMIKRILAFKEGIQGTAVARAKVLGVANQTMREMRALVVKEMPKKKGGEKDVMSQIDDSEDENELQGIAQASLSRLADRGLLSPAVLQMARKELGEDIVAPMDIPVEKEPESESAIEDVEL